MANFCFVLTFIADLGIFLKIILSFHWALFGQVGVDDLFYLNLQISVQLSLTWLVFRVFVLTGFESGLFFPDDLGGKKAINVVVRLVVISATKV